MKTKLKEEKKNLEKMVLLLAATALSKYPPKALKKKLSA